MGLGKTPALTRTLQDIRERNVARDTFNLNGFNGFHLGGSPDGGRYISDWAWASTEDPGISFRGLSSPDVLGLSHEVAEFLNDPFGNVVPSWEGGTLYGCSNLLEVGDPVPLVGFSANGYHLQDEAFLPWFARQSSSTSINGQYTYLGTLANFSSSC